MSLVGRATVAYRLLVMIGPTSGLVNVFFHIMPTLMAWFSSDIVAAMTDDLSPILAKVLTVSDGVVYGTREDLSGAKLAEALERHGFIVVERGLTADGVDNVAQTLIRMSDNFAGVIVSTGGTGFAPRDQTPEGTRQVIEREAPGLAEAMRLVNPLGRLSRGIVGIRGQTIICNTPGSPKGCVEQIEAIVDVLPHAVRLLNDDPTKH
jgi:molybdopterin adenylyltransferase